MGKLDTLIEQNQELIDLHKQKRENSNHLKDIGVPQVNPNFYYTGPSINPNIVTCSSDIAQPIRGNIKDE